MCLAKYENYEEIIFSCLRRWRRRPRLLKFPIVIQTAARGCVSWGSADFRMNSFSFQPRGRETIVLGLPLLRSPDRLVTRWACSTWTSICSCCFSLRICLTICSEVSLLSSQVFHRFSLKLFLLLCGFSRWVNFPRRSTTNFWILSHVLSGSVKLLHCCCFRRSTSFCVNIRHLSRIGQLL